MKRVCGAVDLRAGLKQQSDRFFSRFVKSITTQCSLAQCQHLPQTRPPPVPPLLTCFKRSRNSTDEHGLAWVQRHRGIQDVVGIGQAPRPNLNGFVLDGRRRHRNVQLIILRVACFDQFLHAAFLLELETARKKKQNKNRKSVRESS